MHRSGQVRGCREKQTNKPHSLTPVKPLFCAAACPPQKQPLPQPTPTGHRLSPPPTDIRPIGATHRPRFHSVPPTNGRCWLPPTNTGPISATHRHPADRCYPPSIATSMSEGPIAAIFAVGSLSSMESFKTRPRGSVCTCPEQALSRPVPHGLSQCVLPLSIDTALSPQQEDPFGALPAILPWTIPTKPVTQEKCLMDTYPSSKRSPDTNVHLTHSIPPLRYPRLWPACLTTAEAPLWHRDAPWFS